ncbi:hypothetical protein [Mycobacterium pseudokansasii]|uniref:hypothetical protein n=1 Tax=Mycobacterium pseudokansasii TaxID=2341080 RepID=UPI001B7D5DB8|nr:hypothetical protein [Mycobacterium pseudokansasii]
MRTQLLAISSTTIDRYLRAATVRDQIKGKSTTKTSPLLRSSIKIRKATDEAEASPGFFEGDTVAHCGPTLKGEFARTLNLTDAHIGWVFTRTVPNNAHTHILGALKTAMHEIPYEVTGLDFDNGTEFLNKSVIKWAGRWRSSSPAPGRRKRTTRPPSSPRTTIWRASTCSTTATTPTRNAPCSTASESWSTTGSTT